MNRLDLARQEIRECDEQIAHLFEKRMNAVKVVADYKKEKGIPVLDEAQEKRVIERNSAFIEDELLRPYYIDFIKDTMKVSRDFQHHLMETAKIAYSGVEGAFAHIAARKIFPDAKQMPYASFSEAYQAVQRNECDAAVLPIENSYAGEVGQVLDLMFEGDLYITGVYDLHISQNLLGLKGAKASDIKTVISHPQALGQCAVYLQNHHIETLQANNTARAAQSVAEQTDITLGAIASKETAKLYGLDILEEDINESSDNCTRFAVFTRSKTSQALNDKKNAFILLFTCGDTAGSLAKAVSIISDFGYNMKVLRSRPVKTKPFEYYFYVEALGDDQSESAKKMIQTLSTTCDMIKVVGNYHTSIILKDNETL